MMATCCPRGLPARACAALNSLVEREGEDDALGEHDGADARLVDPDLEALRDLQGN